MVPKQKGLEWEVAVPWKRVLRGFVVIMDCMNHSSAKKKRASLLRLDMFGPSVLLLQRRLLLMVPKFPSWPFSICCTLMRTEEYSGHAGKWWQALPRKKPGHSIARGCFHTAGRVWGVSSGSVTLFVSCEATEWLRLQGGCISGRLRPTHLVARWMTVRRWAMCLLGAFCSGRDASGMVAVDGTSDAY